jgi:hypothetical protein
MAEVKEKLRHLFRELVKDQKNRCRLQFEVLKEYREAKDADDDTVLELWTEELKNRFPKEFASYAKKTAAPLKTTAKVALQAPKVPGNIVRRETLATGDCFFSSIFRAAIEQGLIHKLMTCLKLKATNEKEFIQAFRNMLAVRIVNHKLPKYEQPDGSFEDTHDVLLATFKKAIPGMIEQEGTTGKGVKPEKKLKTSTYQQVLRGFPIWFRIKFNEGIPDDKNEFERQVAEGVRTMTNWIGTIEVEMTKHILNAACKITLKTYSSDIANAEPVDEKGQPTIHLRNLGEAHWEYFSFDLKKSIVFPATGTYPIPPAKGGKRTTRKKAKGRV